MGSISEYPLCHVLAYKLSVLFSMSRSLREELKAIAVGGGGGGYSEIAPTFFEEYVERSDKTHSVTFTRGQATPA